MGQLSPLHSVTLSKEKRTQAQIPADANYYGFVYPLRDSDQAALADEIGISPQALDLARHGGYIYFRNVRRDGDIPAWSELAPQVVHLPDANIPPPHPSHTPTLTPPTRPYSRCCRARRPRAGAATVRSATTPRAPSSCVA